MRMSIMVSRGNNLEIELVGKKNQTFTQSSLNDKNVTLVQTRDNTSLLKSTHKP